jgi:hypothetical protein
MSICGSGACGGGGGAHLNPGGARLANPRCGKRTDRMLAPGIPFDTGFSWSTTSSMRRIVGQLLREMGFRDIARG